MSTILAVQIPLRSTQVKETPKEAIYCVAECFLLENFTNIFPQVIFMFIFHSISTILPCNGFLVECFYIMFYVVCFGWFFGNISSFWNLGSSHGIWRDLTE